MKEEARSKKRPQTAYLHFHVVSEVFDGCGFARAMPATNHQALIRFPLAGLGACLQVLKYRI